MPWTGDKQGPHIDKTRLQAAAETKFELTVEELRHMLYTAIYMDGPVGLRYPRGKGVGVPLGTELHKLEIGKAELCRHGSNH